ncbi:semaphorin-1A-like [Lytechinus variegatus]|uniref:semaphorin-1A-like n=1 Tax=Lytechinus variegatus TaxID=7654 RepID=UPI001BB22979|nr:semaphorin-1A-like [Lytechinus variegatus]
MERGLSQLHVLAVILYLGCLANQSQQEVLTCSMENDTSISSYDVNRKDVRIIDGSPVQDLILLGSNQTLDFIRLDQNNNVSTADIGVCYSTAAHSCYQAGTNEEECDNYIRSVTFLHEDCPSDNCKVLVCGTNAIIPRCGICNYTAEELKCSFKQNEPPQEWPYNSTTDAGYGSCQGDNIVAGDVFQYEKNDNASSLYVHQDGKIYFGHTKRDSGSVESEIGIASISEQGEISNVIKTRENSQKMIAQDADLVGTPFIRGDYAYFLFREDSQESASSSVGQPYPLHTIRSRIARICKDDAGSSGNLVSYLKQQLLCSKKSNEVWETTPYVFDDIPMEYNEIQDFEIKEDGADTLIYAIFTNERNAYPFTQRLQTNNIHEASISQKKAIHVLEI